MNHEDRRLVVTNVLLWLLQLVYMLSPIDLVPDIVPIAGWSDDLFAFGFTLLFTLNTLHRLYERGRAISGQVAGEGRGRVIDAAYEPVPVDRIKAL